GIFIVLSGFATTDLSVRFCDACQGGGAYGKTPFMGVASSFLTCPFIMLTIYVTSHVERSVRSPQTSDRA
ncbi:MAG: hypothetical protein RSG77_25170, partial [Hafnia sp.]